MAGPTDELLEPAGFSFDEEYPLVLPDWAAHAVAEHDWRPLAARVVRRCAHEVFRENAREEMFVEALTASVEENVAALRDVVSGLLRIEEVPLVRRLDFAALEAELRVSHAALQRSYRISFFLQWQEWAGVIATAATDADVSRAEALRTQGSLTALVNAYTDAVVSRVAASFSRSQDAFNRSRAHVRQRLVREVLDGREEGLSPADLLTLEYPLEAHHLGILLPRTSQGAATQLMVGLRQAVRPSHHLVHPTGLGSCVVWLAQTRPWGEERVARAVAVLETTGVQACVSEATIGLSGFRLAYEQALAVERILAGGLHVDSSAVIRHSALRLEILLLQDPVLAQSFLRQELGPLAEETAEAAKLRATLEASFRLGSHVATAEHLALHEHTVRNRLQKATELLGPLHERRTELQVALRLWRILAGPQG
ncbi:hypothetical protein GCM10009737_01290 [Nocardioides lentus]|uniref:PucR family transcriptional regulator n=1 Tax=Nocardioides lentus TaxID=338077 RepID=A0ABP5A5U0_9ACTN